MSLTVKTYKNLYKDSVSLMQITAKLLAKDGVINATVAMQTDANLQRAKTSGLELDLDECPNDLLVACLHDDSLTDDEIFSFVEGELFAKVAADDEKITRHIGSISQAVEQLEGANFALISVPGRYAASEALKALKNNLNVMLFSDNVSEEDELMLKQEAVKRDLLMMGPDCGTAIINGYPLAFANKVNRGDIGVIGASGTGTQEVTCGISNLGAGISQAIGTGGRDLHEKIGALTTLYAIDLLKNDDNTKVIVVISKPPAEKIASKVIAKLQNVGKKVVVHFVGNNKSMVDGNIYYTKSLIETAMVAVALSKGEEIKFTADTCHNIKANKLIKGIFCGGTFCAEAQNIALLAGLDLVSNVPIPHARKAAGDCKNEHSFYDMGDDEYTNGKPHPMIDPSERDAMIVRQMQNPDVGVILFDVVIGYGSSLNPVDGLIEIIRSNTNPNLKFVCHVCGTELDIQDKKAIIQKLKDANVIVAKNNADAINTALLQL